MAEPRYLKLVPQSKVDFSGEWFNFDGFRNFPEFISRDFLIGDGGWAISRIDGKGHGVRIEDEGTVEFWFESLEEEKNCYATIIQLLRQKKGHLPKTTVTENFSFKIRGYHLDIARGAVPKLDTFKRLIRWLFLLKYNVLAIYFEDLYPWKHFQEIGVSRGRITQTELSEIVAYAESYGIEVIPSLELLGHMENFLSLPEYSYMKELWWVKNDGCIDLTNESARDFAKSLLEDVLSFPKWKHVHIGGDETWSLGRGRSLDITGTFQAPDLYLKHYAALIKIVRDHGKIPILWGDMLIGMTLTKEEKKSWEEVARSEIWDYPLIANWDYDPEDAEHFNGLINSVGHLEKQLACPSLSNFNKLYPNYEIATKNIQSFISAARKNNLPGFLITAWGDDGEECLFSFLDPLILAAMEISEGSGEWEERWLTLSGEDPEVFEVRKELGMTEVAERIKDVIYINSEAEKFLWDWGQLDQLWRGILKKSENLSLPEDLQFIVDCLKVGIDVIEKKPKSSDYLWLASEYSDLWLRERKREGLARILTRFWGSAGVAKLESEGSLRP